MSLRPRPSLSTAVRAVALGVAIARVARGARRAPTLTAPADRTVDRARVSVIIPARDEAERIGPALASLVGQGADVTVVDDGSTDATTDVARRGGADVIDAGPLPDGWAGKAHALQVGLDRAVTPLVISVDADCRAEPGFVAAMVEAWDRGDGAGRRPVMVTAATRVSVPDPGGRALHASMLASLVYRFGPPGVAASSPARAMANGQCMVFDRAALAEAGGFAPVADNVIEDIALVRHLAASGRTVWFADATPLLTVTGYGDARATWHGWGRSLSLADVTSPTWLVADLAVVWAAMAAPLPRIVTGRGDAIDWAALALRFGVVAATAGAFTERGTAVWTAPLADVGVAVRLTLGALRPSRTWRGRTYA